ncbi:PIN domain-containing protein [Deinococcus frigens]|uniref:PIN domain-containing protein n=1 Tax=Deinococcus frigens TaxID=249403 RepID=UPI0024814183|nr:PIN domain-containing protein [Deinococcus frigens]
MDANVVVGELLRRRGQERFEVLSAQMFMTPRVASEAAHELKRRLEPVAQRAGYSDEAKQAWLLRAMWLLQHRVTVMSEVTFLPFKAEARRRVPGDPDDWPTAALALALDADIWTEDKHFFGCGLSVWRTAVLYRVVEGEEG